MYFGYFFGTEEALMKMAIAKGGQSMTYYRIMQKMGLTRERHKGLYFGHFQPYGDNGQLLGDKILEN